MLLWVSNNTQIHSTTASDLDIQPALALAARSAAGQVVPVSNASNNPRVHADNAHSTFKKILAKNLGLDEVTLNPLPGSNIKRPDYTFVVYNVDETFNIDGANGGKVYKFQNGILNTFTFSPTGTSYLFGVDNANISPGVAGTLKCKMDSPGVVVSMSAELNRVMGKDPIIVNRWAAAKLVKVN
ncbi:conserved hypothetical protein [Desulforamulus reducens MI-1]|uniref:Uncharacterized protein n=2 Tax=Desulforamulus TaxID=2916693 RepID=A4J342_DESRM|nr:conserved hypothetical protein [Desulforamulus reducens MI-1]